MRAAEQLAEAQTAFANGALNYARNAAWRAAAAAAQIGDAETLERVVELTRKLDDEQLRIYAEAALEDARKGTRPPSAFERLLKRDKRPR